MTEAPERIWATINGSRVSTYSPPFLIGGWESRSRKIEREVEYVRADLFDAVKAERDTLEARVKALEEALNSADDALTEAEAILGGEYGDHYQTLCDTMIGLRDKIAALQENTDEM